jgi:hypothetical protein
MNWIDVNDRLPGRDDKDSMGRVLVAQKNWATIQIAKYFGNRGFTGTCECEMKDVIAWMLLPELPKPKLKSPHDQIKEWVDGTFQKYFVSTGECQEEMMRSLLNMFERCAKSWEERLICPNCETRFGWRIRSQSLDDPTHCPYCGESELRTDDA